MLLPSLRPHDSSISLLNFKSMLKTHCFFPSFMVAEKRVLLSLPLHFVDRFKIFVINIINNCSVDLIQKTKSVNLLNCHFKLG